MGATLHMVPSENRAPQREHGRGDQHGGSEDPDPQGPHGQAVKVATAENHQGPHTDEQASECPGPAWTTGRDKAEVMD
jgi:hypothetical protein